MKPIRFIALLILSALVSRATATDNAMRPRIDLQGMWQFELDAQNKGLAEQWQLKPFSDAVTLPGTTDTNQKGVRNTSKNETTHL